MNIIYILIILKSCVQHLHPPVFQWVIVCELGCWATITRVTITMVAITMVTITVVTITMVAITMVAIPMVKGFSSRY